MDKVSRTLTCSLLFLSLGVVLRAAPTIPFVRITNNSAFNEGIGEAQFSMELLEVSSNKVEFVFYNSGPAASSITDIYFDNGLPATSSLQRIKSIDNSCPGVQFSAGASPRDLPGGHKIDFDTTCGLSLDSKSPVQHNGINPGESLGVTLLATSYEDVLRDLYSGALRVGLHVQGFRHCSSESYVNGGISVVPVPASILLTCIGGGLVRLFHGRRINVG